MAIDYILLSVRDLGVDFRVQGARDMATLPALGGISFNMRSRGTLALVGESGSGKSVTALAIMGLLPRENSRVHAGSRILFEGRDLLALPEGERRALRGRDIAMIFQEPMSALNPVFSVGFQLCEVLTRRLGLSRRQARSRALELLREVGIAEPDTKIGAYPFQLSGGQQQRVMIAMAIACEPKLLIADEPTTALDVTVQSQILELIAALQQRLSMALLFISHDLGVVRRVADEVVVMRGGAIREQGAAAAVFEAPRDAYTRALLACRPRLDARPRRLPVIADFEGGAAPAPAAERHRGMGGDEPIVLEVRGLAKSFHSRCGLFGTSEFKAVQDVSFKLPRGRTVGLVGESGSGKTTVGLALARLSEATAGSVLFEGTDLLTLPPRALLPYRRRIQVVFQNPYASLNPRFTVGRILMEPLRIHGIGGADAERRRMCVDLLARVGLPADALHAYPHQFSGGQRQRIAIARCLTLKPEVLICDESVSALDVSVQAQVLNLLQDLQDEFGLSYLFISHDLAVVRYMADEVLVMSEGRIVEAADADEIYRNPQHPYTRKLLSAVL